MQGETPNPAGETISFKLYCAGCEYSLIGLPRDGVCPECGLAIAGSLEQGLTTVFGPRGVRRLRRWPGWMEAGVGCHVLSPCFPPFALLGAALWVAGAWGLARDWDADTPTMQWHAREARAAAWAALAGAVATLIGAALLGTIHLLRPGTNPSANHPDPLRLVLAAVASLVQGAGLGWSAWTALALGSGLAAHLPRTKAGRLLRQARQRSVAWALGVAVFLFLWTSGILDAPIADAAALLVLFPVVGWFCAVSVLNALSSWRQALRDAL